MQHSLCANPLFSRKNDPPDLCDAREVSSFGELDPLGPSQGVSFGGQKNMAFFLCFYQLNADFYSSFFCFLAMGAVFLPF